MTEATPTLAEHIGARLREARTRQGITQDHLAMRLGFSQPQIATIERGDQALHALSTLALLCSELGVTIPDLLAGSGNVVLTRRGQPDTRATLFGLRSVLLGAGERDPDPASFRQAVADAMRSSQPPSDAERKVAARVGVAPATVAARSVELWGARFVDERERRLAAVSEDGDTERTLQARRGHITRSMTTELTEGAR